MKKSLGKRILILITLLAVFLSLLYLVFTALRIVNYGKEDHKTVSDVAIILGAGTTDGQVSPVYRERINHGIWLYENGYVDFLIVTGGTGEGNSVADAEAARQYALSKAVPDEVIFVEDQSTITEENLEYAKEIMTEQSWGSAIIVSDPLHMKRAMLMAEDYGIAACSSPTPTTMYQSFQTKLSFLVREEFFYIGYCVVRLFR